MTSAPFQSDAPEGTEYLAVDLKNPNTVRDMLVRGSTIHARLDYGAGRVSGKVRSLGSGALRCIEIEGGLELRIDRIAQLWLERRPCTHSKITKHANLPTYICTDDDRPDCHAQFTIGRVLSEQGAA